MVMHVFYYGARINKQKKNSLSLVAPIRDNPLFILQMNVEIVPLEIGGMTRFELLDSFVHFAMTHLRELKTRSGEPFKSTSKLPCVAVTGHNIVEYVPVSSIVQIVINSRVEKMFMEMASRLRESCANVYRTARLKVTEVREYDDENSGVVRSAGVYKVRLSWY